MSDTRIPRLFVEADLSAGAAVPLERQQRHYLVNVLRMKDGGVVAVFNGRDGEWRAELRRGGKDAALVAGERTREQPEASGLALMFAPLRQARQDYVVQKAVELGVGRLLPVVCDHSQVRRVNSDRYRSNAIEAAEQCELISIPDIAPLAPLAQAVEAWCSGDGARLVFGDEASHDTDPLDVLAGLAGDGPVCVLVGPEGGFSEAERRTLRAAGTPLPLGPRVMRADTAAVAALALVQAALGDWRHDAPRWGGTARD